MARKPKIQAVVSQSMFDQFQQWKLNNGFETDGNAIRAILSKVMLGEIGEISTDNEMYFRIEKIESILKESLDRIKRLEEKTTE